MHRIRTWARQKAHGPTPLVADPRRIAAGPRPRSSPGADLPLGPVSSPGGSSSATVRAHGEDAVAINSSHAGARPAADTSSQADNEKPAHAPKPGVGKRFLRTTKDILLSSVINVLLVFVPIGIAAHFAHLSAGIVFAMNAIAIIPLAGMLSHATESVASRLGDTVGALMNVTFGNAVELIIFIALVKNEIHIVQASLVGSILANLLLILGMCFLLGGLRYREQIYNSTVTQMSACLLSLSVSSLLLPTAFHASFSDSVDADAKVLKVSRGTSVVLLLVYLLYLLFQLNSHAYMYESTPQEVIERESVPGPAASYFNSSSSSESSDSSSSSDSDQSRGTAGRIKHAIKKSRHRFHNRRGSSSSSNTETPRSPLSPTTPTSDAGPSFSSENGGEARLSEMGAENAALPGFANAADDEAERGDVQDDSKSQRRHKKKQKHRKKKRTMRSSTDGLSSGQHDVADALAASGLPVNPASATAAASSGDGYVRRVDFALAPDTEAQTASRPKPFSLRALASPAVLSKTLSVNVFNSNGPISSAASHGPPTPVLQSSSPVYAGSARPVSQLRRTASLPVDTRESANIRSYYRSSPGAIPPIVPVVVNRAPITVQSSDDNEEEDGTEISRTTAVLLLLVSTGLVALCAEFMVDSINAVVAGNSGLSRAFIGLILLPIVGNAAEHVTGVTVAMKNKMDLALGVALGSSIQIAIFVTPVVVLLGWILKKDMSLYFTLFETVSMFVSAFIVNFLVLDGRSNYLEGALLCAAYVIIAVAAFFYPDEERANALGGGTDNNTVAAMEMAKLMVRSVAHLFGPQP